MGESDKSELEGFWEEFSDEDLNEIFLKRVQEGMTVVLYDWYRDIDEMDDDGSFFYRQITDHFDCYRMFERVIHSKTGIFLPDDFPFVGNC